MWKVRGVRCTAPGATVAHAQASLYDEYHYVAILATLSIWSACVGAACAAMALVRLVFFSPMSESCDRVTKGDGDCWEIVEGAKDVGGGGAVDPCIEEARNGERVEVFWGTGVDRYRRNGVEKLLLYSVTWALWHWGTGSVALALGKGTFT